MIASSLDDAMTASLRKRWFGTHFFNPSPLYAPAGSHSDGGD